ncbi:hypothetical protein NDU88_006472 [Pleurodeles waltl]|uniref:Uncharacterized protein n=1 Tax=Pleurodeles waltl TaxID=8319 RepID=A0AAV7TDJ5_PLEWA|nr:hypothetical protein NDU88_006472 [Pleurodeles waltl]
MLLRDVPPQDEERELLKIIAETYSSIGRDSLGTGQQNHNFKDSSEKRSERGGRSERRTEYVKPRKGITTLNKNFC